MSLRLPAVWHWGPVESSCHRSSNGIRSFFKIDSGSKKILGVGGPNHESQLIEVLRGAVGTPDAVGVFPGALVGVFPGTVDVPLLFLEIA